MPPDRSLRQSTASGNHLLSADASVAPNDAGRIVEMHLFDIVSILSRQQKSAHMRRGHCRGLVNSYDFTP